MDDVTPSTRRKALAINLDPDPAVLEDILASRSSIRA
jgi:hypothetical protein